MTVADGKGERKNALKVMLDLVPVEWYWALAEVTTRGSFKYAVRNWERGMAWSIMIGCAGRHTIKFICGEKYDKETGCHHLAMAAWNLLALMSYDIRKIGKNDLEGVASLEWLEATVNRSLEEVKIEIEAKKVVNPPVKVEWPAPAAQGFFVDKEALLADGGVMVGNMKPFTPGRKQDLRDVADYEEAIMRHSEEDKNNG